MMLQLKSFSGVILENATNLLLFFSDFFLLPVSPLVESKEEDQEEEFMESHPICDCFRYWTTIEHDLTHMESS